MTALCQNVKTLLKSFLYKLGVRKPETGLSPPDPVIQEETRKHGTTGLLEVPTLMLCENEKVVVIVDHDFMDFPSWVEWDVKESKLSVVQMGGDYAELALNMAGHHAATVMRTQRLMLVTGRFDRRNGHYVSFIVRD
ncbi:MAG: hypothetical protein JWO78_2072 [Micavibrio sp.]|nr:hypothetical protein [Micavibrio sp.]